MQRELDGMPTGFNEVLKLNFGDCRLSVAVPTEHAILGIALSMGIETSSAGFPLWLMITCSLAISLGTLIGGKRTVERFSDADIKKLLSGRLLVDGAAARELAARGFSRYLGYTIDPKADIKYTRERSADGKRVYPMRVVPDYVAPRYDIVKGAEALTYLEYQPFGGSKDVRRVSPGAVYFENELGGKILSAAYLLDFGPTWNLQKFPKDAKKLRTLSGAIPSNARLSAPLSLL